MTNMKQTRIESIKEQKKTFILPAVLLMVEQWHNTLDYLSDHDRYKLDLTTSAMEKECE